MRIRVYVDWPEDRPVSELIKTIEGLGVACAVTAATLNSKKSEPVLVKPHAARDAFRERLAERNAAMRAAYEADPTPQTLYRLAREYDVSMATVRGVVGPASPRKRVTSARNQEIIDKYRADPKANSSEKLAKEYGLSRERICQILRPTNVIADAQERRAIARAALAETVAASKAQVAAALEAKIQAALKLVGAGKSLRQAAIAVGFEPHSHMSNLLGQRARAEGIKVLHGRHRDFSERRARVRALLLEGWSVKRIVEHLRANGDPHIFSDWILRNVPEAAARRRAPKVARAS